MAAAPSAPHNQQMTVLADILAHLARFDAKSKASMFLWFSRFLKASNENLHVAASALIISADKDFQVVAKHGITRTNLRNIIAHLQKTAPPPNAESRVHKIENRHFVFESDDRFHSVFVSDLQDSRMVWSVFVTDQEPGKEITDVLRLISTHTGRLITNTILREQLAASGDRGDKMSREIKEMQVCSLNIMEDLQRKNRDLAMLNKISQEITSCTSLPGLARTAVEAVSGAFDGACASLYIMDRARSIFIPYHTTGDISGDVDDLSVHASSNLVRELSKGGAVVFDATDETITLPLAEAVGAKSGIVTPLRAKNAILGFLVVCETRWHRVFTDEEKENLRVLAGTLSVATENADLLSRTSAQVEEMNALTEYIETVVDSVDLAVMVVGADLKIGMLNKGFERIYGQAREQFIGRHIFEAYPHLIDQGFEEIAGQVLGGKPFARFGWRRNTLGGKEVVQNIRVFPHRSSSGNIIGAIVIIEDITEKADLEIQLARSEAKFQSLVEDLGDGYLIITRGKIVYANKAACQLTAITPSELLGMEIDRILSDDEIIAECMKSGGKKIRRESRLIHSAGTWIPIELSLNTCEYGGNRSVSIVIRDVMERKKFEKQLELKNREMAVRNEQITRLNLELEETVNKLKESQENFVKSERLAAITETSVAANHEINNPLFSILGQAQLLLRKYTDQDEDSVQRLKMIEESALRIACVTKKLANLAEPVVKEYAGLSTFMIDVDRSTTK